MMRASIHPIQDAIPAVRQQDARHYGVHPYFTRRPPNVVRAYIDRYSLKDDVVLDPFGGTGVTAIEAMLLGRRAIHNDLNPFANFIARNIADLLRRARGQNLTMEEAKVIAVEANRPVRPQADSPEDFTEVPEAADEPSEQPEPSAVGSQDAYEVFNPEAMQWRL